MKQSQVVIGAEYEAKVSGKVVRVKVLGQRDWPGRPRYIVRNLCTGREITVTAARLRHLRVYLTFAEALSEL